MNLLIHTAAYALEDLKDTHLSDFFRRAYRKERATALSEIARKLEKIIWNMITKKIEYKPLTEYLFLDQKEI